MPFFLIHSRFERTNGGRRLLGSTSTDRPIETRAEAEALVPYETAWQVREAAAHAAVWGGTPAEVETVNVEAVDGREAMRAVVDEAMRAILGSRYQPERSVKPAVAPAQRIDWLPPSMLPPGLHEAR